MENKDKKHTFYVSGTHCDSCVLFVESEIKKVCGVESVSLDQKTNMLSVSGDFGAVSKEEIANDLTQVISRNGYYVSIEKKEQKKDYSDFAVALPLGLLIIVLFFALQRLGVSDLLSVKEIGLFTPFLIGVVASLSTCMAVVGGLLLSMSTIFAKTGNDKKPQMIFHISRIITFFVLGGLLGLSGSFLQFSGNTVSILGLLVGVVMFILGLNLLDIFPAAQKLQLLMPISFSRHIFDIHKFNRAVTPLLAGAITFFLPCGFTQSMQLYALSTGSFATGATVMSMFALGTLPVLGLLSFGYLAVSEKSRSVFFRTVGVVIIVFSVINIISGLSAMGIIEPIFFF
jgi:sulfite exporter TauE/SafE/copper chaperone CopZ